MSDSAKGLTIAVLGGGLVGITTALNLAEAGVNVRLYDRDGPGKGASGGNAGVISPFSVVPQSVPGIWRQIPRWLLDPLGPVTLHPGYMLRFLPWAFRFLSAGRKSRVLDIAKAMHALNHDNVDLFRQHLKGTGHEGLVRDSAYVMASRKPGGTALGSLADTLRRQYGARLEYLDRAALARTEPALSTDFIEAIHMPGQARATDPGRICEVLAQNLRAAGGQIVQGDVKALRRGEKGDWILEMQGRSDRVVRVVLSAGVWSTRLLEPLGVHVPLEAERGYHVVFPGSPVQLENSVMDLDRKMVASSMAMGLRAAGTAEFGGLDRGPTNRRAQALARVAKSMCPDLQGARYETWSGIRPSLPDSLPALGTVPGHEGLIAAFGHSHWGFMMGPKTGRIAANLVMGQPPNTDLTPYDPGRFSRRTHVSSRR